MLSMESPEITLTHLDEPLFDGAGATKRDLVDYLEAVADRIVPVLSGRPLSVIRVRAGQRPFMQKNVPGTRARRSPTGTSSPSPGPPGRKTSATIRSSTTPTRPTGHAGRCTGSTSPKRNRFIQLEGAVKSVNRDLEDKARTLAGIKGPKTNLAATPDGEPITAH
jgi:hypothetical protein